MPRALILEPQRRSRVSSIPMITGPSGTKVAINTCSRRHASVRLDQRFRLSTRWKLVKVDAPLRPMMLQAAVIVRRPGVRMAPVTRIRTWPQVGREKLAVNGGIQVTSTSGRAGWVGMGIVSKQLGRGRQPLDGERQ